MAIVCDWLVTYAGAERVLGEMIHVFPEADIFAVVDFLPERDRAFLRGKTVKTTFIQNLPFAKKHFRTYLPFMPMAVEQLDLSGYDVILSSSHAVAKGVIVGPDQIHISYIHSPLRYAWDMQESYLKDSHFSKPKEWLARILLHYMRIWDARTADGVDYFIANSRFIARRIQKCYRREAEVIYPPVDVESFPLCEEKEDYYLTASRLVSYKKVQIIVEAFNAMPDRKLIVIGDGPEYKKLVKLAKSNITMMGHQPQEVLREKLQHARAFIFAAEEDFGIAPVEAQACGTPVIAYGRGGARESVLDIRTHEDGTGLFFDGQTPESLIRAVKQFEQAEERPRPKDCRRHAETFSAARFRYELRRFIDGVRQETDGEETEQDEDKMTCYAYRH